MLIKAMAMQIRYVIFFIFFNICIFIYIYVRLFTLGLTRLRFIIKGTYEQSQEGVFLYWVAVNFKIALDEG